MCERIAPAPTTPHSGRKNRISITLASVLPALATGLGTTLFMSGLAHAEPMISTAKTISDTSVAQWFGIFDQRALFGALIFGFSLMAAGVWHRSFRANIKRTPKAGG